MPPHATHVKAIRTLLNKHSPNTQPPQQSNEAKIRRLIESHTTESSQLYPSYEIKGVNVQKLTFENTPDILVNQIVLFSP